MNDPPTEPRHLRFVTPSETAGHVGPEGIYLSSESQWYPDIPGSFSSFEVTAEVPRQWTVVTQGLQTHETLRDQKKVCTWLVRDPSEALTLVASDREPSGGRTAAHPPEGSRAPDRISIWCHCPLSPPVKSVQRYAMHDYLIGGGEPAVQVTLELSTGGGATSTTSTTLRNIGVTMFTVSDVDASIAWYTEKLGFTLGFTWGGDPPTFAGVNLGDVQIFLMQGTPNPQGCSVQFVVGNADELYEFHRANGVEVVRDPCPGLADLVEDGLLAGPELVERMEAYVAPLRESGVDTVVLGCTHYFFVRDAIRAALGPDVRLLDSGEAIARRTRQILEEAGALEDGGAGSIRVLTTGDPAEVAPIVARLWGAPQDVERLEV